MTDHRRFLLRLTLATLGMVLLFASVFVGFGWVVSRHWEWSQKIIGRDRNVQLYKWYARAAAGLISWDSDGDGYCDGIEVYFESDPRNPRNHPPTMAICDPRNSDPFCNEWVHARNMICGGFWPPFPIASGTQFVVSGNHPAMMFRMKDGDLATSTLIVAPNAEGALEFDFSFNAPADRRDIPAEYLLLNLTNQKTGDRSWQEVSTVYGWHGPSASLAFCDKSGALLSAQPGAKWKFGDSELYIARPVVTESVKLFVVDRRGREPGCGWGRIDTLNPNDGPAYLFREKWLRPDTTLGDYEWRITAALKSPP